MRNRKGEAGVHVMVEPSQIIPVMPALVQRRLDQPVASLRSPGTVHGKSTLANPFGRDPHQESIKENRQ